MQNIDILYEDDFFLVINKPAGVVVNRAASVKTHTVQDWFESYQPSVFSDQTIKDSDFYKRSGVVHRLDKETSGCLLLAKQPKIFSHLQSQFKNREVKKTYIALVHGKIVSEVGEIRLPIDRLPQNKSIFGVVPSGKVAITTYKRIKVYALKSKNNGEKLSLVELCPQTGRTHQLRVHLKYLGNPIVADYLYIGKKLARQDRTWCPRVFLHAKKLEFQHPIKDKCLAVNASIPDELKLVLAQLKPVS